MQKVSVVMPAYNRAHYIREAVDSILQQDHAKLELIVVNDGSTDATLEILHTFTDARLHIVELATNCGISTARNIGMRYATGDFIAVMDSDDIALPTRLAAQVAYMEQHPDIHILGTDAIKIIDAQQIHMNHCNDDGIIKTRLLAMNGSAMIHPTSMMRSDFLSAHAIQYQPHATDEDAMLWADAMLAGAKFAILKQHLLYYRRHRHNITAEMTRQQSQSLQSRKTKLREQIIGIFFPALSRIETNAIAIMMEAGRSLTINQACAAITAANKAKHYQQSLYGESRQHLHQLIGQYTARLSQVLESGLSTA